MMETSTLIFLTSCGILTYAVMTSSFTPMTEYGPDYLFPAIPAFLLIMLVEAALISAYVAHKNAQYTFANINISIITASVQQAMVSLVLKPAGAPMFIYLRTYQHFNAGVNLPFYAAIMGMDLCFYLMHRQCHTRAVLWAAHSSHHSSPTFNLTTGIRLSWFQTLFQWVFYLPAALVVSPEVMWLCLQFHDVYTFATHTYAIRRLPWIVEQVLVTPSHHRVHHDRRVHKNFGGIFIIWDRFFGTFLDVGDQDHHQFGIAESRFSGPVFQTLQIGPYLAFFDRLLRSVPTGLEAVVIACRGPGWLTLHRDRSLVPPKDPNSTPYALPWSSKLVILLLSFASLALLVLIPNEISWPMRISWLAIMLALSALAASLFPPVARV